ncbi:hypothetical protein TNCV_4110841 [Trichonephila clavipes]|nr:hypothetical protein TNCV_4110841 [Trichonephila clavipes]
MSWVQTQMLLKTHRFERLGLPKSEETRSLQAGVEIWRGVTSSHGVEGGSQAFDVHWKQLLVTDVSEKSMAHDMNDICQQLFISTDKPLTAAKKLLLPKVTVICTDALSKDIGGGVPLKKKPDSLGDNLTFTRIILFKLQSNLKTECGSHFLSLKKNKEQNDSKKYLEILTRNDENERDPKKTLTKDLVLDPLRKCRPD